MCEQVDTKDITRVLVRVLGLPCREPLVSMSAELPVPTRGVEPAEREGGREREGESEGGRERE